MKTQLSDQERERYHRQIIFPGWGPEAQEKLKQATVFIAGAGGLGSPVSMYLAVAGVGTLRICDCGEPELSNLNRQILHDESRIGMNKALSARQTLERLNPDIRVETRTNSINDDSVAGIIGEADLIMDCLDNFDTRHVLNRYALQEHIPLIHGGVSGMNGQITFLHPPETPCLWCIQPGSPPPVLFPIVGATAGVIGTLQALEALKYLSGVGTVLKSNLLFWDGATMDFMLLPQKKNPACPVCGDEIA
jgi:adenylyltransferase/sulfurtransferase